MKDSSFTLLIKIKQKKMKNRIVFFIFCLIAINSSAQNTFFKWYPTEKQEFINNINEVLNGCYIISGGQLDTNSFTRQAYLLKIDSLGNRIMETVHNENDSNSIYLVAFFLPNETNIINFIKIKENNINSDKFSSMYFEKINTETLDIISFKEFHAPINQSYIPQQICITDSLILTHSVISELLSNSYSGTIVNSYNFNFDSVSTYKTANTVPVGFVLDSSSRTIKSFTANGRVNIMNLNYNLDVIDSTSLPMQISPFANVSSVSTNKYVICEHEGYTSLFPLQHIKVILCRNLDAVIDTVEYWNHPDSILYPGLNVNSAFINNEIFITGLYKSNLSEFPYQTTPSYIQITRIDTNMNIIDHHFYGGDAVYYPFKIMATSDGGAIVTGLRYDHTNPSIKRLHPFALKVNNEGLVVAGIEDEFNPISHSAIVFPNPGKDVLNLTSGIQLNNGVFTLFDMQGRPVIAQKINSTEMQIDASNLASGTYVWQIILNNKIVEKGKWVKK